jgi:hypothetical protein
MHNNLYFFCFVWVQLYVQLHDISLLYKCKNKPKYYFKKTCLCLFVADVYRNELYCEVVISCKNKSQTN